MSKLTHNQRASAYELLYRRLVAYHGGGPHGCYATVGSRTDPGVDYEVEMRVDKRGLWYRCDCQFQQHHPSRMCSHVGATWLIWQAMLRGAEAGDNETPISTTEHRRADVC